LRSNILAKNGDRTDNSSLRAANGGSEPVQPGTESPGGATPGTPELVPVDKSDALRQARKLGKKQKKILKDTHRPLDSWEKYRALTDALDEALELVDLGDHKARFALIISGALNVFLYALGASTDIFDNVPESFRFAVMILAGLYAVLAIYNLIQAIESLRPRRAQPYVHYSADTGGYEEYPLGLRFYEDVLSRDMEAYRRAWREVRIGQLNNEVAVQLHALSAIIRAKYAALDRLYRGLQLMVVFAVVLLLAGTAFIFHNKGERIRLKKNALLRGIAGEKGAEGAQATAFAAPQRIANFGVKEPSGVAFHPRLRRLFAIGDEGTLAELDPNGKRIDSRPFTGNLEDVTVHDPTGDLVLLLEQESQLVLYDPVAHREKKRWRMDATAILGQAPQEANQGFEGIAFRPERGRAGGGVFYLAHQRTPAMVVGLSFDPAASAGSLGAGNVVTRWPLDFEDLTAVAYAPTIDRILVLSDKADRILVLGQDGRVESEVPVPGIQQEGLAVAENGDIWIADDKDKSLLRLEGGLQALQASLPGASPGTPAGGGAPPRKLT
jgi:uncharacterized protein YjiK